MKKKLIKINLINSISNDDDMPVIIKETLNEILNSTLTPEKLYAQMVRTYKTKVTPETSIHLKSFNQFLHHISEWNPKYERAIREKLFGKERPIVRNEIFPGYSGIRKVYIVTRNNPGLDEEICTMFITKMLQNNKPFRIKPGYTGEISEKAIKIIDSVNGEGFVHGLSSAKDNFSDLVKHVMTKTGEFPVAYADMTLYDIIEMIDRLDKVFVTEKDGEYLGYITANDLLSLVDYDMSAKEFIGTLPKDRSFVGRQTVIDTRFQQQLEHENILAVTERRGDKEYLIGNISYASILNARKEPTTALFFLGMNDNIKFTNVNFMKPAAKLCNKENEREKVDVQDAQPRVTKNAASLTSLYITEFEDHDYPLSTNEIKLAVAAIYDASNGFTELKTVDRDALKRLISMLPIDTQEENIYRYFVETSPDRLSELEVFAEAIELIENL